MVKVFDTERTVIRRLELKDIDEFYDMMGNPKVMNPIPRKALSREESNRFFQELYETKTDSRMVWAVQLKRSEEMIGIVAFLKNEDGDDEIGYRLREKFWRIGLGTELFKGLLEFGFSEMSLGKIIADVYVSNEASIRILEKRMTFEKEFFNPSDNCMDRRYSITRSEYQSMKRTAI